MEPLRTFEQDPAETLNYAAEFAQHCAYIRESDTDYAMGAHVRPAAATGYQYVATAGGHSGTKEPRWPTTVGGTVVDGSVTWTCEAFAVSSLLRTVSSAGWGSDTGLTVGTQVLTGTRSTVNISGGTLGQTYLVRCAAACSDGTSVTAAFYIEFKRPARVVNA